MTLSLVNTCPLTKLERQPDSNPLCMGMKIYIKFVQDRAIGDKSYIITFPSSRPEYNN